MIRRINAIRSVLGLMLTAGQLIIGFHFLIKIVDFDFLARWFSDGISLGYGYSYGSSWGVQDLTGPFKALFIVLGFMIFSYVLMVMAPWAVERKERRISLDYDL